MAESPQDTLRRWENTLRRAIDFAPRHWEVITEPPVGPESRRDAYRALAELVSVAEGAERLEERVAALEVALAFTDAERLRYRDDILQAVQLLRAVGAGSTASTIESIAAGLSAALSVAGDAEEPSCYCGYLGWTVQK